MNSIQPHLTKDQSIATVKLLLCDSNNKPIIVIEGPSDRKLMCRIFDETQISFVESNSGKEGVIEIVGLFENSKLYGVCDKDYDSSAKTNKRIVYYDTCAMETMLFSISQIRMDLYNNVGKSLSEADENTLKDICKYIGAIRKFNFVNNAGINFKCISAATLYEKNNLNVTLNNIKNRIQNANNSSIIDFNWIDNENRSCTNPYDIIQGHDLVDFLHVLLNVKSQGIDVLSDKLILCANKVTLQGSKFYNLLRQIVPLNCFR